MDETSVQEDDLSVSQSAALDQQPAESHGVEPLDSEQALHVRLLSAHYLPTADPVQPGKTNPTFLDTSIYNPPWFQLPDLATHDVSAWFDWQVCNSAVGCW